MEFYLLFSFQDTDSVHVVKTYFLKGGLSMGNRIRMHLGVELDLTEQELEELCSSRCPQQLLELVQSKRCRICGSSYFTETAENGALAGWECGLPQTPMARFLWIPRTASWLYIRLRTQITQVLPWT